VWKKVVVPNRQYPFAGDLKRFMSIPDIYMGMLDIHGYTRFCADNRHNLSMLDLLDRMIQDDVRKLAVKAGVVSRRSAGDQILLLGASAEDVMSAILLISEYFSKRRRVRDEGQRTVEGGDVMLPEFQMSAGVAGGQKFTPLFITQDGDLSGDIVNCAARLQARANKISPDLTKIHITSHVHQRLKSGGEDTPDHLLSKIDYFNTGLVEFKGTTLQVYDTVFIESEGYRLAYREAMDALFDSLSKGGWKSKIFEDALWLVTRIVYCLPDLVLKEKNDSGEMVADKARIMTRVKNAQGLFNGENFGQAIRELKAISIELSRVRCMDAIVLEYLNGIVANYERILTDYEQKLDKEVLEHLDSLYSPKDKENFLTLLKHHDMFDHVQDGARAKARNRKSVWFLVADSMGADLGVRLQSEK
jgi:class 3 adenylate cyclase